MHTVAAVALYQFLATPISFYHYTSHYSGLRTMKSPLLTHQSFSFRSSRRDAGDAVQPLPAQPAPPAVPGPGPQPGPPLQADLGPDHPALQRGQHVAPALILRQAAG